MVSSGQHRVGLQLMKFRLGLVVVALVLAGCEGSQVVEAPSKRPSNVNMSRGTAANVPAANNQGG